MEIPITKDIRKFKTKDIGNFSLKQVGVIALGLGIGFITYKLSSSIEAAVIPLGIIIILGFFKPYGMSCIQFIKTVGVEKLSPPVYINETDFVYDLDRFGELYGEEYTGYYNCELIQREQLRNITKKITNEEKALIIR
jgi:hypothetical protein